MASHGKVFDLFDDRYLELQDVVGNVEPLPTLVPYEQYKQHLITYRMDTSHDIFLALLQDFTERKAIETGKELWTWYVQWHVDETATNQPMAVLHSPKKPRLDFGKPNLPNAQRSQPKAGLITAQTRVLDPELMHEEDMLRILVDIVQVNNAMVPNFIEFLYRWIDFYEGDGKALKAALRGEIPSLWDFEYHPIVVPGDVKKKVHEANDGTKDENSQMGTKTPKRSHAEELAQSSPTKKMRERPDLAALERKAEESERLQYREVHFGIQPPKLNEPLPPLINIPRDPQKRSKYYASCFKSRQRAFYMLMEAGVTAQHMRDYKRGQRKNVKDTPFVEGDGLRNYEQDAQTAQKAFLEKEKHMKKQMEIAISTRLAEEVHDADCRIVPEGASGVPIIPATAAHVHRPGIAGQMLRKIQHSRDEIEQKFNIVPAPLVGKMKSKLFEGAKDREAVLGPLRASPVLPTPAPRTPRPPAVDPRFEAFGSSSDEDSDDEGSDGSNRMRLPSRPSLPPPPHLPRPSLPPLAHNLRPSQAHQVFDSSIGLSTLQQNTLGHMGFPSPATTPSRTPTPPRLADFMKNITPEQAQQLLSQLNQNTGQLPAASSGVIVAGDQDAQDASSLEPLPDSILRPSNPPARVGQTLQSSLPVLALPRAPVITISPPHAPINGSQHQAPRDFGGSYNPFTMQPPTALADPHASSSFNPDPALLPMALDVADSTNGVSPYPAMHGMAQHAPPQQLTPSEQPQPYNYRPNLAQQTYVLPYPVAPGLLSPAPPPAFAQRLVATQQEQGNSGSGQGLQQQGTCMLVHQRTPPPLNGTKGQLIASQPQLDPRPPIPFLTPLRPGMQRSAPSPLNLLAPLSPLSSLAPSVLSTSPFATSRHGIPLQVYFPKLLVPGNTIGPGGAKLGDGGSAETDAFLLGHAHPGSGKITFNKAVFLPVGVWRNAVERVRKGKYSVLESYPAPGPSMPNHTTGLPHRAAYEKMKEVYSFIVSAPPAKRERELTKRWRVSKGRMTASERGAVWEGWGVEVDRGVSLSREERNGAVLHDRIIGGDSKVDKERERRRREIEEMLEEEEAVEDMDMEM